MLSSGFAVMWLLTIWRDSSHCSSICSTKGLGNEENVWLDYGWKQWGGEIYFPPIIASTTELALSLTQG